MELGVKPAENIRFYLYLGVIITFIALETAPAGAQTYDVHSLCLALREPKIQALLDTISYAEGTFSKNGYRMHHGFSCFDNFKDHPRKYIYAYINGKGYRSTSAGRYQFLRKTWEDIAPKIGAKNFSPYNQDLAAVALIMRKGALKDSIGINSRRDFTRVINKINTTWAALPGSHYGQSTKSMAELEGIYKKRLQHHTHNKSYLTRLYPCSTASKTPGERFHNAKGLMR